MRVLHIYKTFITESYGGIERVIYEIAKSGSKYGYESSVMCLTNASKPDIIKYDEINVYRSRSNFQIASMDVSLDAFKLYRILLRNTDIIHFHYPWPFMDFLYLTSSIKRPFIVTYHSDIVRQRELAKIYYPFMIYFLQQAKKIIATSPNYLSSSSILQKFNNKAVFIPIGISDNKLCGIDQNRSCYWKRRFGPKFFLFIGALRYYKGLDVLLAACKYLDYPVVIAGNGSEYDNLIQLKTKLKISNAHFIGEITEREKNELLYLCEAVILPSTQRSEAFGVALVEGAASGKPLICCEIETGTTFININGKTGFTVPPNDPIALSKSMQAIWNNPIAAKQMGANARKRYEELFLNSRMTAAYYDIYQELYDQYFTSSTTRLN